MNPVELICRKRDGLELSAEQIGWFIREFVAGRVPEYQMSALAMAIYFQGMSEIETATLTREMLDSGTRLTWDDGAPVVDKHSTGGVGDKTSLILAPLLAECGLRVPMISGRGLGPTGGTLDKLEAIPGFRTDLSLSELQAVVADVGCVITGATRDLVPADRKLYALRDVTGTVPSIPLITASIMSKKLAESLDALVLDVKWGSGAFMRECSQAVALADAMRCVGEQMGVATTTLITDMNQPLGRLCGNAVEVVESLDCLSGGGPTDLLDVTLALGAELLVSVKLEPTVDAARERLAGLLASGKARERFERMVAAQGGTLSELVRTAPASELAADRAGYVRAINTAELGMAVIDLGGGRREVGAQIDHSVGLEMLVRIGDQVSVGQPLVKVFARGDSTAVKERLRAAIEIGPVPELVRMNAVVG